MSEKNIKEELSMDTKPDSILKQHKFFFISYGTLGIIIFVIGLIAIIITGACKPFDSNNYRILFFLSI